MLMAVELVLVTAILIVPLPVTKAVTSMLIKVLAVLIAPDEPADGPLIAGSLLKVMLVSPQLVLLTPLVLTPVVEVLVANRRNVTWEGAPLSPVMLNFK
jgi:hypothetical protein